MADNDDFWEAFTLGQHTGGTSPLDRHLQAHEERASEGIRLLTDQGRAAKALRLPVEAGTRVSFKVNLGSVMSYDDPPGPDAVGTVVMVRTADGDQTGVGSDVFVKWDDGKFLAMDHEHLRKADFNKKLASSFVRKAMSLGDLSGFIASGDGDNDLVHKATKDLWSFSEDPSGGFVISRLFDDTGEPLKV